MSRNQNRIGLEVVVKCQCISMETVLVSINWISDINRRRLNYLSGVWFSGEKQRTMVIGKACAPGFWRLRRGAGMQYRQPTNVLQFGARRAAYTVYNRPTRVWANAIYQRPTRRIQLTRRIYDRSTRKIHLPNVYARSTRKIQSPLNVYERPTRRIGQQPTPRVNERTVNDSSQKIQHTPEERAMIDEFNIRPCHVVVEKLVNSQISNRMKTKNKFKKIFRLRHR